MPDETSPEDPGSADREDEREEDEGDDAVRDGAVREMNAQTVCLYCGTHRAGAYCHECGQKYRDAPITLRELVRRAFRVVSDVENGILYTIRTALRNPGEVARRYANGETRRFVNPISYLLLTVTLLYVALGFFEEQYVSFIIAELRDPMYLPDSVEPVPFDPENPFIKWFGVSTQREYAAALFEIQRQYLTLINAFNILPLTLGTWLFFRKRSTLAETAVLVLYVIAQTALYNTVIVPVSISLNSMQILMSVGIVVSLGLHMWAATAFYKRTAKVAVFALLSYVTGTVIGGLCGGLVAAVFFALW